MNPIDGKFAMARVIPEWSVLAQRKIPSAPLNAAAAVNFKPLSPAERRFRMASRFMVLR